MDNSNLIKRVQAFVKIAAAPHSEIQAAWAKYNGGAKNDPKDAFASAYLYAYAKGHAKGHAEGYDEGYYDGFQEGANAPPTEPPATLSPDKPMSR